MYGTQGVRYVRYCVFCEQEQEQIDAMKITLENLRLIEQQDYFWTKDEHINRLELYVKPSHHLDVLEEYRAVS